MISYIYRADVDDDKFDQIFDLNIGEFEHSVYIAICLALTMNVPNRNTYRN